MSAARFHVIAEGFRDASVNKTQLSLALKQQLKLDDAQLADLMAGRRLVLARNLAEDKARRLGRKLNRAGLNVRAETAAAHQKISPEELRHHLLDGGLSHYFAGRHHHAEDDFETRLSLAILAGVPLVAYVLLPLIALLLALPLLSPSVWPEQPTAACAQAVLVALLLTPAWWLRPVREPAQGVKLDPDTEGLMYSLCDEISHYLDAPSVVTLRVVDGPLVRLRQTPLQWVRGQCELELGLAFLQGTTLQLTTGAIAHHLAPLAPKAYHWQWGLYRLASRALARRLPALSERLDDWVRPMHDHQAQRQSVLVQALIGRDAEQRLQSLNNRLAPVERLWPDFQAFCQRLSVRADPWRNWLATPGPADTGTGEDSPGLFRIGAPASWALSNADGYRKALRRARPDDRTVPANLLWRQFQAWRQAERRLTDGAFPAEALVPPTAPTAPGAARPTRLDRRYRAMKACQAANVRHALGLSRRPPRQTLSTLSTAWREAAAPFWSDGSQRHRNLPLAKALYLALSQAEQIELWARQKVPGDTDAARLRERQLRALHQRWLNALKPLPSLPIPGARGQPVRRQLRADWAEPGSTTAEAIAERSSDWVNALQICWTLVAASLLNSPEDTETGQEAA